MKKKEKKRKQTKQKQKNTGRQTPSEITPARRSGEQNFRRRSETKQNKTKKATTAKNKQTKNNAFCFHFQRSMHGLSFVPGGDPTHSHTHSQERERETRARTRPDAAAERRGRTPTQGCCHAPRHLPLPPWPSPATRRTAVLTAGLPSVSSARTGSLRQGESSQRAPTAGRVGRLLQQQQRCGRETLGDGSPLRGVGGGARIIPWRS